MPGCTTAGTAPGMNGATLKVDAAEAAVRTSLESGVAVRDSVDGASSMASTSSSQAAGPLPVEPQRPKVKDHPLRSSLCKTSMAVALQHLYSIACQLLFFVQQYCG
jgi:hypothetical protein